MFRWPGGSRWTFVGLVFFSVALSLSGQDRPVPNSSPKAPDAAAVADAFKRLRSDSFGVREQAMHDLWAMGKPVEPALRKAAEGADREVAARCRAILSQFKWGLTPGVSPELESQILRFVHGNSATRKEVLASLVRNGNQDTAVRLVNAETPPNSSLISTVATALTKAAQEKVAARQFEGAEQLFRTAALMDNDVHAENYVLMLFVLERLSEKMELWRVWRKDPDACPDLLTPAIAAKWLAMAHRMRHEHKEAMEVLDQHPALWKLQLKIATSNADWKKAWAIHGDPAHAPTFSKTSSSWAEWIGIAATCANLAGDQKAAEKWFKEVMALGKVRTSVDFYCLETMLINHRYQDAAEIASAAELAHAFEIYVAIGDMEKGFELLGTKFGEPLSQEFVDRAKSSSKSRYLGLAAAHQVHRFGYRDKAKAIFEQLTERYGTSQSGCLSRITAAVTAKLDERADHWASQYMETGGAASNAINKLHAKNMAEANRWWEFLAVDQADRPREDRLKLLRNILLKERVDRVPVAQWEGLLLRAADFEPKKDAPMWPVAVAELAKRVQLEDIASAVLRKSESSGNTDVLLRLGDQFRKKEDHAEAARLYRSVTQLEPNNALARHLLSLSLEKLGNSAEAKLERQIALILPLATRERQKVSDGLRERSLMDAAAVHWKIGICVNDYLDFYHGNCLLRLSEHVNYKDLEESMRYWQLYRLGKLSTRRRYTETYHHVSSAVTLHTYEAFHLLAQGKGSDAVRSLETAADIYPLVLGYEANATIRLRREDMQEVGHYLFQRRLPRQRKLLAAHPKAAGFCNQLAWNAALNRQELDWALELAEQAVKLEPGVPRYRATLCEVQFRRGEYKAALDTIREVYKDAPYVKLYKAQWKRCEMFVESDAPPDRKAAEK